MGAAILLPLQPAALDRWTDSFEARVLAGAYNSLFAEQWLALDNRFHLAMVVSSLDPIAAATDIRQFGNTPGVAGVLLTLRNILPGDRHYYPIYEAAQDLGLPIMIHVTANWGIYNGLPTFAGGIPSTYAEQYSAFSELGIGFVASLVWEGVFEQFPKLKVVLAELGWTWVAPLVWRMDAAWKAARHAVPWVKRPPSEYILDHVRFTSQPAAEVPTSRMLRDVLEMMHASRTLLFSTDYPHWDSDYPEHSFLRIPSGVAERIYRLNAVETFGSRLRLPVSK